MSLIIKLKFVRNICLFCVIFLETRALSSWGKKSKTTLDPNKEWVANAMHFPRGAHSQHQRQIQHGTWRTENMPAVESGPAISGAGKPSFGRVAKV